MITESMNTNEVLRELQKDEEFVSARGDGLLAKNNKKMKNKFVKNGDIMSVSHYVVPETKDTVYVFAVKSVESVNGREVIGMRMTSIVKTYYGTYIMANIAPNTDSVIGYVVYTRHFLTRLQERLGKDFLTFFKEDQLKMNGACITPEEYTYKGEKSYFASVGDAYLFIKISDDCKMHVVTTVLSENELYHGQLLGKKANHEKNKAEFKRYMDLALENEEVMPWYVKPGGSSGYVRA